MDVREQRHVGRDSVQAELFGTVVAAIAGRGAAATGDEQDILRGRGRAGHPSVAAACPCGTCAHALQRSSDHVARKPRHGRKGAVTRHPWQGYPAPVAVTRRRGVGAETAPRRYRPVSADATASIVRGDRHRPPASGGCPGASSRPRRRRHESQPSRRRDRAGESLAAASTSPSCGTTASSSATFVWRDIKVRYKQTSSASPGRCSCRSSPLVVYVVVFGRFAKFPAAASRTRCSCSPASSRCSTSRRR